MDSWRLVMRQQLESLGRGRQTKIREEIVRDTKVVGENQEYCEHVSFFRMESSSGAIWETWPGLCIRRNLNLGF